MADDKSQAPQGVPPEPEASGRRIAEALDDPAAIEGAALRLSIRGGVESERLKLDLAVTGRGDMEVDFDCALTKRKVDRTILHMEPRRLRTIFKGLNPAALANSVERRGGFPPCSLIGRLDIEIAGQTWTRYFMADPEQARTAGYEPPAEITRIIEMLYDEAEERLGMGHLRP